MLSKNVIRHGKDTLPDGKALKAGPLGMIYESGELRHIMLGDMEILRRIYMSIRLRYWITVPVELSDIRMNIKEDSFRLAFNALNKRSDVDFFWKGVITGESDGTLTFSMEGEARMAFFRNRIGLCVLHPIKGCVGRPCVVEKTDGSIMHGSLPPAISPYHILTDIRAFSHEPLPGLWVEVRYSGDTFEMEDQRNWTDMSFKTYSTPLSLPYPVEVKVGARISQSVTIRLRGNVSPHVFSTRAVPILEVGMASAGHLPHIGLGQASHNNPLTEKEIGRLKVLNLSHLRVDLKLFQPDVESKLRRGVADAAALNVPLELAIFLSDNIENELKMLAESLTANSPRVVSCMVFNKEGNSVDRQCISMVRGLLAGRSSGIRIGTGTNNYFVELNRNRPQSAGADILCYSANPQVHSFDDDALMDNLDGQGSTVVTAKEFMAKAEIAVTPITLRPRFVRGAPDNEAQAAIGPDGLPRNVDARQMSLLCVAWTACSLKRLAEVGADSVTYYETTGWRGVMEIEKGSPEPKRFHSIPGAVFPVYHILADVGEFAGSEVLACKSSEISKIVGLVLRSGAKQRLIAANLTCRDETVTVRNLAMQVGIRRLDETNAEEAMRFPEKWRKQRDEIVETAGGELDVVLPPYAVIRLDSVAGL